MTYREMMTRDGGTLGWCEPYESDNGRVKLSLNEGTINCVEVDGVQEASPSAEALERIARLVNPHYSDYSGYSDTHIILDAMHRLNNCCDCPFFTECAAMDEDI